MELNITASVRDGKIQLSKNVEMFGAVRGHEPFESERLKKELQLFSTLEEKLQSAVDNVNGMVISNSEKELALKRKCNQLAYQLQMLINEIPSLEGWRADTDRNIGCSIDERLDIADKLLSAFPDYVKPIYDSDLFSYSEEGLINTERCRNGSRQRSDHQ